MPSPPASASALGGEPAASGLAEQPLPGLIGRSSGLLKLCRTIERVAPANVSVALFGESGTGKEVIARAIHEGARAITAW